MPRNNLRNALFNFAGAAFPATANLLSVPYIVVRLGDSHYGLYALIGAVIGYFALLDINATSGSVKYIAEYSARGERDKLIEVISFGLIVYALIGLVGAIGIIASAEWLVTHVFSVRIEDVALANGALSIAGLGFLFGQLQFYLNSIPQSLQNYRATARLEIIMGASVPLLSMALVGGGYGLLELVAFRVCATIAHGLTLAVIIRRLLPDIAFRRPSRLVVRSLAAFSGYAYLSRIAALTYQNADKLVVGAFISIRDLTLYSVPTVLVNRVLGMTFRLIAVLYPVASELDAVRDAARTRSLYLMASRYIVCLNMLFTLLLAMNSHQLLTLWIGEDYAEPGAQVMTILAVAMLVDSLTNLASLFNDAAGYPRVTGLFAIARAAVGTAALVVGTQVWGIAGTALGHLVASVLMTLLFMRYVHQRTVPVSLYEVVRHAWLPNLLIAALVGAMQALLSTLAPRDPLLWMFNVLITILIYSALALWLIVEPRHRSEVLMVVRSVMHGLRG